MEIFLIAVVLLLGFAIFDLVVGVSNDAVNFLNSSIGSKVASRHVIMIIACFGILAGVTFSMGRKVPQEAQLGVAELSAQE